MVTVPVVQSTRRIQTGPNSAQINPGAARGFAADYTGAGDALMRAGLQMVEQQRAREEREQRARDAVEAIKAQTTASKVLSDTAYEIEKEGDFRTGNDRYAKTIESLSGLGAGIKDPVAKARLDAHVQGLAENHRIQLRQRLFKMEADDAAAALDENLDTASRAAAQATNPVERDQHVQGAAAAIKSMSAAGFIDRKAEVNMWQRFKGKIDQVQVEQDIARDPMRAERMLADPRYAPNMDPVQREKAATRAAGLVDRAERARIAQEEKNERRADKMLTEQGKVVSKELWSMWNPDPNKSRLTEAGVERYKSFLPVDEYKALRRAAIGEDKDVKDDRDAVGRLEPMLSQPGAARQVDQAYNAGLLSGPTYRSMRGKAENMEAANAPAKPYVAGRDYLSQALDPGQMGSDPFVRQALSLARVQALADFDTMIEQNPGVGRAEAVTMAQDLHARYQNVAFGQMRIALPRPAGYEGSKADVKLPDVIAARRKVQADIDAKRISPEQAEQTLRQLETWEQIIAAPAPKAKTGDSKNVGGVKKP